jgi:hypothetical protein
VKTRKSVVVTALVLVTLIIATGVVFAQGMGAVNQGTDSTAEGDFSTISGGRNNNIPADGEFVTIGGGENNTAGGSHDTVGGGRDNTTSGVIASTISGGSGNVATDEISTVSGGGGNTASGPGSTIGGGGGNTASQQESTVSGGQSNSASGFFSTVGGGGDNTASGTNSTIPGSHANSAQGDFSFAAGHRAQANHTGTFVWADSTDKDFASTGENQFLIRASGGVGIGTNNPTEQLTVNGKVLAKAFVCHSTVQWKTDSQTLEGSLEKVQNLRGVSYEWKTDGKHDIGLIAEEVGKVIPEVVGYGENGKDAIGVDYAGLVPVLVEAIKEQQQLLENRDAQAAAQQEQIKAQQQITALQEDNHEFEARIAPLEGSVETKVPQSGLLPFNASVMWMLAGGQ